MEQKTDADPEKVEQAALARDVVSSSSFIDLPSLTLSRLTEAKQSPKNTTIICLRNMAPLSWILSLLLVIRIHLIGGSRRQVQISRHSLRSLRLTVLYL